jgi:hypothetical protein
VARHLTDEADAVTDLLQGAEDGHVADLELVLQVSHGRDLPCPQPVDELLVPVREHGGVLLLYTIEIHNTFHIR